MTPASRLGGSLTSTTESPLATFTPVSATLTVQLESGLQLIGFILDSTVYGVLDDDTLGY